MDAEKYWREFENSGRIKDYMSYRSDLCVEKSTPYGGQLGDVGVERFCACNGHGSEDREPGGI